MSKYYPARFGDVLVAVVAIGEIIELRKKVLWSYLPDRQGPLPEDHDPSTMHFAAKIGDEAHTVSCVSYMRSSLGERPAWRLNAMATAETHRNRGIGLKLFSWSEKIVADSSGIRSFWCNARVPAISFYKKNGWVCISETYEEPGRGEYRVMAKTFE